MIGKKVKINHGLFAGSEGVVKNSFVYNGQTKYNIEVVRYENDGEPIKLNASCEITEFEAI